MTAATQAGGYEEDAGWFRDVQWGAHLTKRGAGAERYAWGRARAQARAGFRAAVAAAGDLMVLGLHGAPHVPDVGVRLLRLAADAGEPAAQASLGTLYATGLYGDWAAGQLAGLKEKQRKGGAPRAENAGQLAARLEREAAEYAADPGKAVLHYYFASTGNSTVAQLALGYRHIHGVGVPKSCQAAVLYLNPVAELLIERFRAPGPQVEKVRIADVADGQYNPNREKDMMQYYQYSADMGNVEAQTVVGQFFNVGGAGLHRDPAQALHYFKKAAKQGDADALAHLGHMYANGLGVEQNNETALEYFQEAALQGHANALYGMGYLHLSGYGVTKSYAEAMKYFRKAADQGHAEAQFHLGVMFLNGWGSKTSDPSRAMYFFQMASQAGHTLATYNMAVMTLRGIGAPSNCRASLEAMRKVVERGPWASILELAHQEYAENAKLALALYVRAAEMGLEIGQSNVAYILEHQSEQLEMQRLEAQRKALEYHKGSALQGNAKSMMAAGNIYYYGKTGDEPDYPKALSFYRKVANSKGSPSTAAHANFNLGIMHQMGQGLAQDFHLAKRYYDISKSNHQDAAVPVAIALYWLQAHVWYADSDLKAWVDGWWDRHVTVSESAGGTKHIKVEQTIDGETLALVLLSVLLVITLRALHRRARSAAQQRG